MKQGNASVSYALLHLARALIRATVPDALGVTSSSGQRAMSLFPNREYSLRTSAVRQFKQISCGR